MDVLGDELELALRMADAADAIALRHFRDPGLAVDTKPDGSPVSSADREIEFELRALLEDLRPGDAILGEEGGASGDGDHRWYLDPIDGTSKFVAADPEWYVLIALAVDGRPVVGVVSAPALGERWWASRGAGAFRDGSRLSVSDVGQLAEATVADDWQQRLARGITGHPLATLAGAAARVRRHSGHSHLVVASGDADLASGTGFAWDFAPTKLIVEEAGGRFTDLRGGDMFDNGDALVSNGRIHDQALQVLESRT